MSTSRTLLLLVAAGLSSWATIARAADEQPASATHEEEQDSSPAYLFDLHLALREMAEAHEPFAALSVDPVTGLWNTGSIFKPQPRRVYTSAVVSAFGELQLTRSLLLTAWFDTGELRPGSSLDPPLDNRLTASGRTLGDHLFQGAFIRELLLRFSTSGLTASLGRKHLVVGDGLVFDDFASGAEVEFELLDLGMRSLRLRGSAFAVGHTVEELRVPSPLLVLALDYELSMFEKVGLYGAVFLDRGGALADVMTSALGEQIVVGQGPVLEQRLLSQLFFQERASRGRLNYLGLDGNLLPARGFSLRGAAALSFGDLLVTGDSRTYRFDLRGWGGSLDGSYGLTPAIGVGFFGVALSGGRAYLPFDADGINLDQAIFYDTFIGVAPYWTWTGLFFSGGLSQGLYPGRATAAGVNGHGVLGLGPTAELSLDDWLFEVRLAYLRAMVRSPAAGDGAAYGWEVDLTAEWQITPWLQAAVETDLFLPGNFFPSHSLAYRAIAQLNVQTGN